MTKSFTIFSIFIGISVETVELQQWISRRIFRCFPMCFGKVIENLPPNLASGLGLSRSLILYAAMHFERAARLLRAPRAMHAEIAILTYEIKELFGS